jgi:hypothetical protein
MSKHLRADGPARGPSSTASDGSLRPALTDIPGACAYLGKIGRSKFYSDLLPELDVVRFGTRTFITLESLDRLIAANCQLAIGADEISSERSSPERECQPGGRDGPVYRGTDGDGRRVDDFLPSRARPGRPAQVVGGPVTEPEPYPPRDDCKLGQG